MGVPPFFNIFGLNFMNFEDFSKYFAILGGKFNNIYYLPPTKLSTLDIVLPISEKSPVLLSA